MIDSQTYFWVFSTIIQAFAALVALIGMFIVYRLQLIKSAIDTSISELGMFFTSPLPRDELEKQIRNDIESFKNSIKNYEDDLTKNPNHPKKVEFENKIKEFNNLIDNRESIVSITYEYHKEREDIIKRTKPIFFSNGVLISLAIIVLPLQNFLGSYGQVIVIGIGTILALAVLISTFQHMWKIMSTSIYY